MKKKSELYKENQNEILRKIIKIIGITTDNNRKNRDELETEEIKESIRELTDDIIKYYSTSKWKTFIREYNQELNVIKNIMKEHGIEIYKLERKRQRESDGKYESYRLYIFNIPKNIEI
jgi:hypothetical protein